MPWQRLLDRDSASQPQKRESWSLETLRIAALGPFVAGYAFIAGCRGLTEYDLGFATALALIAGHAMTEGWRWSGQGATRGWRCHQLPIIALVMRG